MSKIALVTLGVKLEGESKGYTRFKFLSEFLSNNGHQVDLITSTFQHWEKKQRKLDNIYKYKSKYKVILLYEPGYKKNIDIRRIYSHAKFAKNLRKYFSTHTYYDLIYSEIPPNDVALVAAESAKNMDIPFVVDVNDLWPEAMRMVIDIPIVSDILFYPLKRDAEKVYNLTSGVIGTSDEYANRPFQNCKKTIDKITVYVGSEIKEFDDGVKEYGIDIQKSENEFWVSYAGTIGTSYDIKTLILASEELKKRGYTDIYMIIMGGGPLKNDLENMAKSIDCNVKFMGYVPYKKMAAYLHKSDILINSFVRKAPQSIVTKIGDYLSAGRPMINTCVSEEFRKKVETDGFGLNIEPEDKNILADAIEKLYKDKNKRILMGEKARQIAEKQFDRPKSYKKILNLINKLLEEKNK